MAYDPYYFRDEAGEVEALVNDFKRTIQENNEAIKTLSDQLDGEVTKPLGEQLLDLLDEIYPPQSRDHSTLPLTYRVKPGDTLTAIADSFGLFVDEILVCNDIKDPNLIYPDQVIYIYPHRFLTPNS